MILADEQITTSGQSGNVLWPLSDHLGTVRDLVDFNPGNNSSTVVNHIVYDAFGRIVSETVPAVDHIFGYTGRERDEADATGLYYYRARYYDPGVGRFISEDPIGFAGGDANLVRYVSNQPTRLVDPNGLYGVQGHYWTVYLVALAAGKKPSEAFWLAYYSQLPDQNKSWDAKTNFLTPGKFGRDLYDCVHSLHGGDKAAIELRRNQLAEYLRNNYAHLSHWQRGIVLHALGDAYAHTYIDRSGMEWAYGMTGHKTLSPDIIGYDFNKYTLYVSKLYTALGGVGDAKDNTILSQLFMRAAVFETRKDITFEYTEMPNVVRSLVGYPCLGIPGQPQVKFKHYEYIPTDNFNTYGQLNTPSDEELQQFMDKMRADIFKAK